MLEIRFPKDQQEGTEATVTQWLVAEGEAVNAHQPVVEIETDKVVVEVAAPAAGSIVKILIQPNEAVNPGAVLATLSDAASADQQSPEQQAKTPAAPASEPQTNESDSSQPPEQRLSPAVRQRVLQHHLDLSKVTGSGRGGRITLKDIEPLIAQINAPASPPPVAATGLSTDTAEIIPHDKMRQRIAANMVGSLLHTAPHVTAVFEADLSAITSHRAANKKAFAARGVALTFTVYFVAAAVAAIRKVPQVNSRWYADRLEIFPQINIGIGTALGEKGLIVPVLHNAQDLDLAAIATGLAAMTARARDGALQPEDVRGGTFTISNHGVSGSLLATPIIINQPQSAILGIGKIEKRIKIRAIDGEDVIAIRPMCYVSLTVDHRVLDGFQTNAFLTELVSTLENWPEIKESE